MTWPAEWEDRVARRITQLVRDSSIEWQIELASALEVLPLYADLGIRIGLSMNGRFIAVGLDDLQRVTIERHMEIVATASGIRRFPELADVLTSLLPRRPADALPCVHCNSSGRVLNVGWCGGCSGLGWRRADGATP